MFFLKISPRFGMINCEDKEQLLIFASDRKIGAEVFMQLVPSFRVYMLMGD